MTRCPGQGIIFKILPYVAFLNHSDEFFAALLKFVPGRRPSRSRPRYGSDSIRRSACIIVLYG